jgi:cytochrome P450
MSVESPRLPPGPDEIYRTTDDLLGWMQANFQHYGDIYQASVYGERVYVINSPEYLDRVLLRNWRNYLRKGQAVKRIALSLGNGLISSNGQTWVRQRRMIQPAFKEDSIRRLFGAFIRPNTALLEKWRKAALQHEEVDVTRDVSLAVLEATLLAIFGEDYDKIASDFSLIAEESRNMEFAQTCAKLATGITKIANDRRQDHGEANDILGLMMRALDRDTGKRMSDAELNSQAMTLVIAGHETTASVLNWIWYLVAKHPQVELRLTEEINRLVGAKPLDFDDLPKFSYTHRVIEEALRTYPPLWLMTRKAMKDDVLGDYFVPKGTEIYISPYLLQRHPRLWEDPDRFDPDRPDSEFSAKRHPLATCPFGAGPRNCIGELFARIEMQVHILLIARSIRLRYTEKGDAEFVAGVNLLSRDHFIMQPELRERST